MGHRRVVRIEACKKKSDRSRHSEDNNEMIPWEILHSLGYSRARGRDLAVAQTGFVRVHWLLYCQITGLWDI